MVENNKDDLNIIGSEILIYQTDDGQTKIDVKFEDETVWLTQAQLCELYQTSKSNISEHIKHIFEEGELEETSVVRKFRTTASDGKKYNTTHYNLDMIISLGYRVKSKIATNFRRWATERLKEYMIKGFTMDDERLKNLGGGNYWKELLDRIRDIRSSEKVMYRQVLDLYATSVDYDPKSRESIAFFKMVQNKLHYAAHGHTAAEVIYERADASQPFMGLKSFSGDFPTLKDIGIAKNYLNDEELKILNNIVSGYFDFAENAIASESKEGMINAISNLKRALDCEMDMFFESINLKSIFDKKNLKFEKKTRFLADIGLFPIRTINKLNSMRNKMEHEYKTPEISDLHAYYELVWSVVKIINLYLELLYMNGEIYWILYRGNDRYYFALEHDKKKGVFWRAFFLIFVAMIPYNQRCIFMRFYRISMHYRKFKDAFAPLTRLKSLTLR